VCPALIGVQLVVPPARVRAPCARSSQRIWGIDANPICRFDGTGALWSQNATPVLSDAPKPAESARQPAVGADPGGQASEFFRKVCWNVPYGLPVVTDIVDGLDQSAHGVRQVCSSCRHGLCLRAHVTPLSELKIKLAVQDPRLLVRTLSCYPGVAHRWTWAELSSTSLWLCRVPLVGLHALVHPIRPNGWTEGWTIARMAKRLSCDSSSHR
jgi:hypothetical protein